ncbi:DUF87 domain-containing protein [Candidatus Acetothermia bacterium]|nr:DUF87 domain-containing protein [Candidatus Acetothermia bacterium]
MCLPLEEWYIDMAKNTSLNISRDLTLNLEEIIGQCIAILGIRGSGKSNTAGVIFEELLKQNYPLTIVDIDGEYFGLKEHFEVLVIGSGDNVDIEIDLESAAEIAEISLEKGIPLVLDLSSYLTEERNEFLKNYLKRIWSLAGKLRRPYIIGIEESHEFIPQGIRTELKELIARIALRGRKRGLGAIIISQRSAKVEKDVLSQAGMLFLHRVVHEADMRVYCDLLPWRKNEVKEVISHLGTGDSVYVNGETILPIYVRERETFHAGFTPSLTVIDTPQLKQVSQSIVAAIKRAKTEKKDSQEETLKKEIIQIKEKLAKKDQAIQQLEEVARTLGYIKFEVPSLVTATNQQLSTNAEPIAKLQEERQNAKQSLSTDALYKNVMSAAEPVVIDQNKTNEQQNGLPLAVMRHIESITARVGKRDIPERRLLSFLINRAPASYSVAQLAGWTGCASEIIATIPLQNLLDLNLVVRERRIGGYHYRSNLKPFVLKEFSIYQPDITEKEFHLITVILKKKLTALAEK